MFLLLDIGGTKIRVATSKDRQNLESKDLKKTLEKTLIIDTKYEFNELIDSIKKAGLELAQGESIEGIAGGSRGFLDPTKSFITDRRVFKWENAPLKQALTEAFGVPIFLENDAALAALGEATFGAASEFNIVAFYTVSTGLGGAKIVNRSIDPNAVGFEPGKQIVDFENDSPVILEDKISGEALKKRYGKPGEELTDPAIWDTIAKDLAIGINNAIVFWSPECIVLGGSVMKSVDIELVRTYAKKFRNIPNFPSVRKAALGEESGLYGALAYLNTKAL